MPVPGDLCRAENMANYHQRPKAVVGANEPITLSYRQHFVLSLAKPRKRRHGHSTTENS